MTTFVLSHALARENAIKAVREAPDGYWVEVTECLRTLEQNAYQWPYLHGFSEQKRWPVNGELVKMSEDDWKDVLTCAFEEDVNPRLAKGINGGIVMLGRRTSKYGKKKFALWMEYLIAIAAAEGVEPVFKNGHKRWESENR